MLLSHTCRQGLTYCGIHTYVCEYNTRNIQYTLHVPNVSMGHTFVILTCSLVCHANVCMFCYSASVWAFMQTLPRQLEKEECTPSLPAPGKQDLSQAGKHTKPSPSTLNQHIPSTATNSIYTKRRKNKGQHGYNKHMHGLGTFAYQRRGIMSICKLVQ